MHDATIQSIEQWLRAAARQSARSDGERPAADDEAASSADPAQQQDRPFWPYLESDDFWRE
ncbi:MAG: hypothetical protein IT306_30460 [Chloroflexi bacterium]|nr:hypothetical protein [Chloroflexota bacterium]